MVNIWALIEWSYYADFESFFSKLAILPFSTDEHLSNRQMKAILINHFGDSLVFIYPKDQRKSQIFYSSKVHTEDIIETMRISDPIDLCAKKLKSECQTFDFGLNDSFRYASDLEIGIEKLHSTSKDLKSWNRFVGQFFPTRPKSEAITCNCDMLFQIFFNIIHGGQVKTPLHTAIAECIHDTCKSKLLIQIF